MVEVDAFWAYAIGAGYALSTAEEVQAATGDVRRQRAVRERQLVATLLFMGSLFVPMGMCLAVRFPGWETMYAVGALPPWGLGLFSAGVTVCAALGHQCAHRLLVGGRTWAAALQLVLAYIGMFFVLIHGWDGTGLHRLLAPKPQADFPRALLPSWQEITTWLRSPVALTLLVMGLVLMPALLLLNARAHTRGVRARLAPSAPRRRLPGLRAVSQILLVVLGPCLALAIGAHLAIRGLGVPLGGLLWAASAAVLLRPGGLLAAHSRRILLPSVHGPGLRGVPPTPPIGRAASAAMPAAPGPRS
ncbi:hypothetical protein ACGFW5_24755 [Streptomyces sp. NPDC048416]|uniref:hypothetical protein n=1 Tax=Streptomyces sp. NPDC048416 TaxID=3365546 RepID=UPI00371CF47D